MGMRKRCRLWGILTALWMIGCDQGQSHQDSPPADKPAARAGTVATPTSSQPAVLASAAPTSSAVPVERLEGIKHHALVQKKVGFYGVLLPDDYAKSNRRYPLAVILHGSGSTEEGHGKLANEFGRKEVIYLLPRAPHAHHSVFTEQRKPGWTAWPTYPEAWGKWDSPTFPKEELKQAEPRMLYADWIASTIEDVRRRYRVNDEGAVVFGHSQGAAFAHELAVRHPGLVKAYFAYAGYYNPTTENMGDASSAIAIKRHKVAVAVAHHEADDLVKIEQSKQLVDYFKQHNVAHDAHLLPSGSHKVTPEVKRLARNFVQRWCCQAPVAGSSGSKSE